MEIKNVNQVPLSVSNVKMKSPTDLLNNSLSIYKTYALKFIGLQLIPAIPIFIMMISVYIVTLQTTILSIPLSQIGVKMYVYFLIFLVIISIVLSIISQIGQLLVLKNVTSQRSISSLLKNSLPLFIGYFFVIFLVGIITGLGVLALIIPGIYFGILYCLAPFVFIFEGTKGMAALRRSKDLIKGNWWKIFGMAVIIYIVFYIISYILSIPTLFIEKNSAPGVSCSVIVAIIKLIISPIIIIYFYSIYQDLSRIKDSNNI